MNYLLIWTAYALLSLLIPSMLVHFKVLDVLDGFWWIAVLFCGAAILGIVFPWLATREKR